MYSNFEAPQDCVDSECPCTCHTTIDSSDPIKYDEESTALTTRDGESTALVKYNEEHTAWSFSTALVVRQYEQEGTFPFLKLPGDLRDRIYR